MPPQWSAHNCGDTFTYVLTMRDWHADTKSSSLLGKGLMGWSGEWSNMSFHSFDPYLPRLPFLLSLCGWSEVLNAYARAVRPRMWRLESGLRLRRSRHSSTRRTANGLCGRSRSCDEFTTRTSVASAESSPLFSRSLSDPLHLSDYPPD